MFVISELVMYVEFIDRLLGFFLNFFPFYYSSVSRCLFRHCDYVVVTVGNKLFYLMYWCIM